MIPPKIPQHTMDRSELQILGIKTDLEHSKAGLEHLKDVEKWRESVNERLAAIEVRLKNLDMI